MKFRLVAALLGLATTATAQYNQTGPFFLHITGSEGSSIDGYAFACHTGAALEGLCYGASAVPSAGDLSSEFYFNYTDYTQVDGNYVGILAWNLHATGENDTEIVVSEGMGLTYQVNSNVAAPQFGFSSTMNIGFDKDNNMFGYSYIDDSTFVAGQQPTSSEGKAYYQWFVCWQYFTGYYYQSVGWTTGGEPHNPTCEAVTIIKVDE
ncbi:hypothetical protein F5Y15DRAFT_258055 [Xylariaceae sp. FL0016]|nr:hypothetical protein F5Y15DRAFT_258055 [Xylariaceae sp. FL0016]